MICYSFQWWQKKLNKIPSLNHTINRWIQIAWNERMSQVLWPTLQYKSVRRLSRWRGALLFHSRKFIMLWSGTLSSGFYPRLVTYKQRFISVCRLPFEWFTWWLHFDQRDLFEKGLPSRCAKADSILYNYIIHVYTIWVQQRNDGYRDNHRSQLYKTPQSCHYVQQSAQPGCTFRMPCTVRAQLTAAVWKGHVAAPAISKRGGFVDMGPGCSTFMGQIKYHNIMSLLKLL